MKYPKRNPLAPNVESAPDADRLLDQSVWQIQAIARMDSDSLDSERVCNRIRQVIDQAIAEARADAATARKALKEQVGINRKLRKRLKEVRG